MERLFRGITWLLGNSVVLPQRPGYFRLLICLFFIPLCFGAPRNCSCLCTKWLLPYFMFIYSVLKYFILVFILL